MPIEKYNRLIEILKEIKSCAIAVSGGLDSMFLALTAKKALGNNMLAITVSTPYMHSSEIEEAKADFIKNDINYNILALGMPEVIANNPENRCYLCKKTLFKQITEHAAKQGFTTLLDGTNAGDLLEHRPGLKALEELNVRSPLKEAGLDKNDIRSLAKQFNYSFSEKDSNSCLLTRLPYNYEIRNDEIRRIEKAEAFLKSMGFRQIRVRAQNNTCRIEVRPDQIEMLKEKLSEGFVSSYLEEIGFQEFNVDTIGYKAGRNK